MKRIVILLLCFSTLFGCQSAASGTLTTLAANQLAEEYERSAVNVRGKYDGKEITVRGYAATAATMPRAGDDQGSIAVGDRQQALRRAVTCWFSKDENPAFASISGGQEVIVKGVFNGEAGLDLKFCKLIKIE